MKVESSTIQNKFLRVQTLNYGASLFEVYHKKKKIIGTNIQALDRLVEDMQVEFPMQNLR